MAVGVVESRRAEDEWYSPSYGQCHKNLASGIAGVRTDRAGVARPMPAVASQQRWIVGETSSLNPLAPEVHLCLRIKDEAGLFAGALGLELG